MTDATRQYGTNLSHIRRDHVARYEFAASRIKRANILDAACGIGYGSRLLHDAGNVVTGVDIEPEAIEWARLHFDGPDYLVRDLMHLDLRHQYYDLIVSFETLEHLESPVVPLRQFRRSPLLIASVPNERQFPFDAAKFAGDKYPHKRHYTPKEFDELLNSAGWEVVERHCQRTKHSDVERGTDGMFLVYVCA